MKVLSPSERDQVAKLAEDLAQDGDHGNTKGGLLLDLLRTETAYQELAQQQDEQQRELRTALVRLGDTYSKMAADLEQTATLEAASTFDELTSRLLDFGMEVGAVADWWTTPNASLFNSPLRAYLEGETAAVSRAVAGLVDNDS